MDSFVESAILTATSADGFHAVEQHLPAVTDAAKLRERQQQARGNALSLGEQLALNRQVKNDLFAEKHDVIKARSLTREDAEWLDAQEAALRSAATEQKRQEILDALEFQRAVKQTEHESEHVTDGNVGNSDELVGNSERVGDDSEHDAQPSPPPAVAEASGVSNSSKASMTRKPAISVKKRRNSATPPVNGDHEVSPAKKMKEVDTTREVTQQIPVQSTANDSSQTKVPDKTAASGLSSLISYASSDDDD